MKNIRSILRIYRGSEGGATTAETAISIGVFLTIILAIIQITLAIHVKFLVNYAAYCATRAGIVHNGFATKEGRDKMRQAVAVALTPLFSKSDSEADLIVGYAEALLLTGVPLPVPVPLGGIKIEILDPLTQNFIEVNDGTPGSNSRFSPDYSKRFFPELRRYDEAATTTERDKVDENLLTVRITYGFPLKIPFINRILDPPSLFFDPFDPHWEISSTHRMRMQSDRFTR